MTNSEPITVPEGTQIQTAYVRNVNVEVERVYFGGQPSSFATTIELAGNIKIDAEKPVYILQFEDDKEHP